MIKKYTGSQLTLVMNRLVLNLTLNEPQSEHFKSTSLLLLLFLYFLADIPFGVELSTNDWDQANQTTAYPCQ